MYTWYLFHMSAGMITPRIRDRHQQTNLLLHDLLPPEMYEVWKEDTAPLSLTVTTELHCLHCS